MKVVLPAQCYQIGVQGRAACWSGTWPGRGTSSLVTLMTARTIRLTGSCRLATKQSTESSLETGRNCSSSFKFPWLVTNFHTNFLILQYKCAISESPAYVCRPEQISKWSHIKAVTFMPVVFSPTSTTRLVGSCPSHQEWGAQSGRTRLTGSNTRSY